MAKLTANVIFRSKPAGMTVALLATVALGYVDYVTGQEVGISAFYLLPISLAAWAAGRRAGLWLASLCGLIWWGADVFASANHVHPLILAWNGLMLWGCFAAVAYLVAAFHDAHHHLEDTVAQRTAALQAEMAARQQAEHAKLQAERLAVAGTMAAQLAHEIRNPLGSITLNLDLIGKEITGLAPHGAGLPEESRILLNEMRAEVRRIQGVLGDYLAFTRLPKPNRRSLNLNELLEQKLAFMQAKFDQAKVALHREFDPALPAIVADADQLWQAVLNLVQNALDAMPDGGTLTVATGRSGAEVLVRVTDTGIGMTADQAKQVFLPFFSTKARGTGLGLAITQRIIAEHGGHIECATVRGRGSTFTISLPLSVATK